VFRTANKAAIVAIMVGAACAMGGGCSSSPTEPSSGGAESTGIVGLSLVVSGVTIDTVSYSITGPNGYTKNGSIDVSHSTVISAVIGGIPVGNGYTITLTATSVDGTLQCSGSAMFNVTAHATTAVTVKLDCHQKPKTGGIGINGSTNVCPSIQSVSASPDEVLTGGSVAVSASASDPDGDAITYKWVATSGTFANASAGSTAYTCTAPGMATLTVTASDGDNTPGCPDSQTVQVTCSGHLDAAQGFSTSTPIKHIVVVFNENISFDHYFGTYPNAQNNTGEAPFSTAPGTATPNGLTAPLDPTHGFAALTGVDLLNHNPNLNPANGAGASNPFRLGPAQAATADQGHNYKPEQQADDNGAMDLFPLFTGTAGPPPGTPPSATSKALVMAYYDGNTVSALWNWAQTYAMSDNSWTTVFGPSTPGAINLIAGQTNGFGSTNKSPTLMSPNHVTADGNGGWTLIGDTDPIGDVCSLAADQNNFTGKNVGDLLNAAGISWGWFEGGFDLTLTNANGTTGCSRLTVQTGPGAPFNSVDYIPHHQPFQYYPSTANLTHARPSSVGAIGKSVEADGATADPANHQYDSHDFFDALAAGNLPAVVYLKAPAFQDGHAGYSNPIDEQNFLLKVVATVQASQEWASTAIVVAYDDSDGWYDHQAPPIVNPSAGSADFLNGMMLCNSGAQQTGPAPVTPLLGANGMPAQGRCGYGTRIPLVVISPYAKSNFIDHTLTDQSSLLRFVEDNWLGGQRIQPGGSFDTIAGSIQGMFNF
jgi:phospholipase C